MFSLARRRREAQRAQKLDEVFREYDTNGSGSITAAELVKMYADNEVAGEMLEKR